MMKELRADPRIVLTLDAGGTNMVFSALQGQKEVVEPVRLPSESDNFERCYNNIKSGFSKIISQLQNSPVAISFSFPGPSDYKQGIIGDLPNLPAFRGGVALGPMLEKEFGLPVYINNDGNLFALGEAMGGFLPFINGELSSRGIQKKYTNLIGITLGTGFGGGFVCNGEMLLGDNSNALEIWLMRNRLSSESNAEDTIGIRAISLKYSIYSKEDEMRSPKDIFEIASGRIGGDRVAALRVYDELGIVLGDTLATLVNILDACVVIGGGISSAHPFFMKSLIEEMSCDYVNYGDQKQPRMVIKAFNVEDPLQWKKFMVNPEKKLTVGQDQYSYDPLPRVAVGISKLGTSQAISLGAYYFAINSLDKK